MSITEEEKTELDLLIKIKNNPDYVQNRIYELKKKARYWYVGHPRGRWFLRDEKHDNVASVTEVWLDQNESLFVLLIKDPHLGLCCKGDSFGKLEDAMSVGESLVENLKQD